MVQTSFPVRWSQYRKAKGFLTRHPLERSSLHCGEGTPRVDPVRVVILKFLDKHNSEGPELRFINN